MEFTRILLKKKLKVVSLYLYTLWYLNPIQIFFGLKKLFFKASIPVVRAPVVFRPANVEKIASISPNYVKISGNSSCSIFRHDVKELKDAGKDYLIPFSWHYWEWINSLHPLGATKFASQGVRDGVAGEKWRWHPYTCSKRIISISIFILNNLKNYELKKPHNFLITELKAAEMYLSKTIEYNVGANHVLTNYAALTVASKLLCGSEFNQKYYKYKRLFNVQFSSSVHFERSYAYSVQLVYEALLVWQIAGLRDWAFLNRLREVVRDLRQYNVDGLGEFGDRVIEQTPQIDDVWRLLQRLGGADQVEAKNLSVAPTYENILGYQVLRIESMSLVIDAGSPSPRNQPGHAHDSTGALAVTCYGNLVIGSSVTTTYERCLARSLQRSRRAYSKVINYGNVQEPWASFRVARRRHASAKFRAREKVLEVTVPTSIGRWWRTVTVRSDLFEITDTVEHLQPVVCQFILGEGASGEQVSDAVIMIYMAEGIKARFSMKAGEKLRLSKKKIGAGYGQYRTADIIKIHGVGSVTYEICVE